MSRRPLETSRARRIDRKLRHEPRARASRTCAARRLVAIELVRVRTPPNIARVTLGIRVI
jgi:hypothetical protein